MSVREGAENLEAVVDRWDKLAAQTTADSLDEIGREVGDVAEGFMKDLAVFAEATAQEVGLVDLAFVAALGSGYMDST